MPCHRLVKNLLHDQKEGIFFDSHFFGGCFLTSEWLIFNHLLVDFQPSHPRESNPHIPAKPVVSAK